MEQITLQIKPAGNCCNLDCSYCYAKPFIRNRGRILETKLLRKLLVEASSLADRIVISWHGGEPLLAGLGFFEEYVDILDDEGIPRDKVTNLVQTNAVLVDDAFAVFFRDNGFVVSVSLDGPPEVHDRERVDFAGRGTCWQVMSGVSVLRDHGLRPPVIATVTRRNITDCEAVFGYLVDQGFREIKYSPVYDSVGDEFSISSDQWYGYLRRVLELWLERRDPALRVRELDELFAWFSDGATSLCHSRNNCSSWISVDESGLIYPCEYLRCDHPYGDIAADSLASVFSSRRFGSFSSKIAFLTDECRECRLLRICHNGCPATRVDNNELKYSGKYVYCDQRRRLFSDIENIIGGTESE